MTEEKYSEHVVFHNASGSQVNYANHGSTIYVSNGQGDELGRLIQELRRQLADTDRIPASEKESTYEILEMVRKGGQEKKSLSNLLLDRLQKWQAAFGATSAVGQVISSVMDIIK
ncbi:hypothetical protein ACFQ49_05000 [Kroppenstedtia eburnea]|uniref:hypothetical protein n=1 Tax=Kroppenstedtia eburnea TaxID=714067 RepID=UPI00020C82FC|nr:hypothetical protein HMPREF9374_0817 [Desmospora sp. 8437]